MSRRKKSCKIAKTGRHKLKDELRPIQQKKNDYYDPILLSLTSRTFSPGKIRLQKNILSVNASM